MFHYHFPTKNNKYDHPQSSYEDYIDTDTDSEMLDINPYIDTSAEIETELSYGVHGMRREFRKTAKRLRKLYSNKEPRLQYKRLLSRQTRLEKGRANA